MVGTRWDGGNWFYAADRTVDLNVYGDTKIHMWGPTLNGRYKVD